MWHIEFPFFIGANAYLVKYQTIVRPHLGDKRDSPDERPRLSVHHLRRDRTASCESARNRPTRAGDTTHRLLRRRNPGRECRVRLQFAGEVSPSCHVRGVVHNAGKDQASRFAGTFSRFPILEVKAIGDDLICCIGAENGFPIPSGDECLVWRLVDNFLLSLLDIVVA